MKIVTAIIFFSIILYIAKYADTGFNKIIVSEYIKRDFPFLSEDLVMAVIEVESGFKVSAFNPEDNNDPAIGLMQIRVSTAHDMGFRGDIEELYVPATNIYYGMKYLAWLHDRFPQDPVGMIMSYNEGIGNYRKGKRVWGYYRKIIVAQRNY